MCLCVERTGHNSKKNIWVPSASYTTPNQNTSHYLGKNLNTFWDLKLHSKKYVINFNKNYIKILKHRVMLGPKKLCQNMTWTIILFYFINLYFKYFFY